MSDTMTLFDTISLGALIRELEKRPIEESVLFNFGGFRPTGLHSYRGFYDHLALGYAESDGLATVGELLKELRSANGGMFTGYKGGNYRMGLGSPVWVANPSEATSTTIIGLGDCEYSTVLLTGYAG